jgi:hypothetical protein
MMAHRWSRVSVFGLGMLLGATALISAPGSPHAQDRPPFGPITGTPAAFGISPEVRTLHAASPEAGS